MQLAVCLKVKLSGSLILSPSDDLTVGLALKLEHLELIFVRLLHTLAHHPDFAVSHEQLPDMAR
jgi:hypothetical protein